LNVAANEVGQICSALRCDKTRLFAWTRDLSKKQHSTIVTIELRDGERRRILTVCIAIELLSAKRDGTCNKVVVEILSEPKGDSPRYLHADSLMNIAFILQGFLVHNTEFT